MSYGELKQGLKLKGVPKKKNPFPKTLKINLIFHHLIFIRIIHLINDRQFLFFFQLEGTKKKLIEI